MMNTAIKKELEAECKVPQIPSTKIQDQDHSQILPTLSVADPPTYNMTFTYI
ncbi:hypothetical protein HK096_004220, partial [Nowakowskiella sp. JEL0078]